MDIFENNYGAALLNDCKYGGRVFEGTLELNLQRGPKFPSLNSEQGEQEFKYAFLPHPGTLAEAQIAEKAAAFNREPLVLCNVNAAECALPFALDTTKVMLAACKRAEKSDDIIVRLVERYGTAQRVMLSFDTALIASAGECDLMEWQEAAAPSLDGKLILEFKPFEIKTLRLKRK